MEKKKRTKKKPTPDEVLVLNYEWKLLDIHVLDNLDFVTLRMVPVAANGDSTSVKILGFINLRADDLRQFFEKVREPAEGTSHDAGRATIPAQPTRAQQFVKQLDKTLPLLLAESAATLRQCEANLFSARRTNGMVMAILDENIEVNRREE